jgi:P27 family predicted phage terminase small subunit
MPAKLRMLHGESRPSQIGHSTAQPADRPPVMPASLSPAAKVVWNQVLADQAPGIIRAAHAPLLRIYCDAVVRYEEATLLLAGSGLLFKRRGDLVKNPLHQIVREAADQVRLAARELGLTPSSVAAFPDLRPAEPDPMAALLTPKRRRT